MRKNTEVVVAISFCRLVVSDVVRMFSHPALRDALQRYLGSRHALRCASSELYAAYTGLCGTLLALKEKHHKVAFVTLPSHRMKLDGVVAGILRKGSSWWIWQK